MPFDPCIIQPGTLRHIISIQAPSNTRDSAGQQGSTWTTVLTTRASIESTASQTFKYSFQNSTLASNATDCVTLRFPPTVEVTPGMQVVWGDQVYTIQACNDVQRRHRVLVLAVMGLDTPSS